VTGRRGRRGRKQLIGRKERRGYSHLKEEDLDGTVWRAGFGRGFGPVVRQTAKSMNEGYLMPISVALRSEVCVCGHLLSGIVGSNSAGLREGLLL
jgi:hypothetical protein